MLMHVLSTSIKNSKNGHFSKFVTHQETSQLTFMLNIDNPIKS